MKPAATAILTLAMAIGAWPGDERGEPSYGGSRHVPSFAEWARTSNQKHDWKGQGWEWRGWYLYDPAIKEVWVEGYRVPNRDADWRVRVGDAFGHEMNYVIEDTSAEAAVERARDRFRKAGHDRHQIGIWDLEEATSPSP